MLIPIISPLVLMLYAASSAAQQTTTNINPSLTGSATVPTGSECVSQYSSGTGAKPTVTGVMQGFNYDADKKDWGAAFDAAANLNGQVGKFTSARLFSMIETNSTDKMIGAIDAAVENGKVTLLLGLFASAGQESFDIELGLLNDAIDKYTTRFTDLIYAVSVGSEDLYRRSIQDTKGKGDSVADIQHYICQTRQLLAAKGLSKIPVGHVDTWQMWLDQGQGQKILDNIDFVGMDDYPYWEYVAQTEGAKNFSGNYENVSKGVKNLPVWITETGWPITAPSNSSDAAQPGVQEASNYWQSVGCGYCFGKINTWWYTFSDQGDQPSFGIANSLTDKCGLFDLTCSADPTAQVNATSLTEKAGSCTYSKKATESKSGAASLDHTVNVRIAGMLCLTFSLLAWCGSSHDARCYW